MPTSMSEVSRGEETWKLGLLQTGHMSAVFKTMQSGARCALKPTRVLTSSAVLLDIAARESGPKGTTHPPIFRVSL